MVGGGKEARRSEINGELTAMQKNGVHQHVSEITVPVVRSTFAKCGLVIPPNATMPEARKIQSSVVTMLRGRGQTPVEGSQGQDIWALPHRTMEQPNRTKAIVSTKDFCEMHASRLSGKPIAPMLSVFSWACFVRPCSASRGTFRARPWTPLLKSGPK